MPAWARSVIRIALALTIVSELTRFVVMESLPWRTRGMDPPEQMHFLRESMTWTLWLDIATPALLGVTLVLLIVLSILRAMKGPPEPATPAAPSES